MVPRKGAEPHILIEQLRKDEAITEADTLLLTVPNQLGVAYNAHVIEAILTHVARALGWREQSSVVYLPLPRADNPIGHEKWLK
jgi:hypothetical protein